MPSNQDRKLRATSGTIDPGEIGRFAAQAESWWDSEGSFRTLHRINPTRLRFIRQQLTAHFCRDPSSLRPFDGLTLLDIGCGGGLVAEPMARLGFSVTGVDAGSEAIHVARTHAEAMVLAIEVIEHVADPAKFFSAVGTLVRPGGIFIGATLNRTPRSFVLAIVGAEYIFRWLPPGTHDWRKFLRPSEFVLGLRRNGFVATRLAGLVYDPWRGDWLLSPDLQVNYMVGAVRR